MVVCQAAERLGEQSVVADRLDRSQDGSGFFADQSGRLQGRDEALSFERGARLPKGAVPAAAPLLPDAVRQSLGGRPLAANFECQCAKEAHPVRVCVVHSCRPFEPHPQFG
jgi:hypothetical protein